MDAARSIAMCSARRTQRAVVVVDARDSHAARELILIALIFVLLLTFGTEFKLVDA